MGFFRTSGHRPCIISIIRPRKRKKESECVSGGGGGRG